MSRHDGGPAFPIHPIRECYTGMTLRDYFAGQALARLALDANDVPTERLQTLCIGIARLCYAYADAMLTAREAA